MLLITLDRRSTGKSSLQAGRNSLLVCFTALLLFTCTALHPICCVLCKFAEADWPPRCFVIFELQKWWHGQHLVTKLFVFCAHYGPRT